MRNCEHLTPAEIDKNFFGGEKRQRRAATMCSGCPMQQECLDIGNDLGNQAFGVFGGVLFKNGKRIS